jgi:AraC family transcriptional regulator
MSGISEVYDLPDNAALQCRVAGRMALPQATIEIHQYQFRGAQGGLFRSSRSFLDLALSPRPGLPRGAYAGAGQRPLGDIIFIPAGRELETEWGEGEQRSVCCGFDDLVEEDGPVFKGGALEATLDVRSAYVREAMVRLAREIENPGFCSEMLAQAIWTDIVIELSRYLRQCSDPEPRAHGLTTAQLRQIEELIEQPGKLPSVTELAAQCDLSTRHFFRMFRAATGTTLASYAADRRMERARQLLAMPRPPVKEIAWRCGFDTPAAFSAAFRKAIGVTPKQYRQTLLH